MKRVAKKSTWKRKKTLVQKDALMLELINIALVTTGEKTVWRTQGYEDCYVENRRTVTSSESKEVEECRAKTTRRVEKRSREAPLASAGKLARQYRKNSSLRQESREWVTARAEPSRSLWKTRAMAGKGAARREHHHHHHHHHAVLLALAPFFFLLHVSAAAHVTAARSTSRPQSLTSSQTSLHHRTGPLFRPSPAAHSVSSSPSPSPSSSTSQHSTSPTKSVSPPFTRLHRQHPFHNHQTIPGSHLTRPPHLSSSTPTHDFTPHEGITSIHHPRAIIHTSPQRHPSTGSLRIISFTKPRASKLRDLIKLNTKQRISNGDYKDKDEVYNRPFTSEGSIDTTSTKAKHLFYKDDDSIEKYSEVNVVGQGDDDVNDSDACKSMEHCNNKRSGMILQTENDESGNSEETFRNRSAILKSGAHDIKINESQGRLSVENEIKQTRWKGVSRAENSDLFINVISERHKSNQGFRERKDHNGDLRNDRDNLIKPVNNVNAVNTPRSNAKVANSLTRLPRGARLVPPQEWWSKEELDSRGRVLRRTVPNQDSTRGRDHKTRVSENRPAMQGAYNSTPEYKYVGGISGDIVSFAMGAIERRNSRKRSASARKKLSSDVSDFGKERNMRFSLEANVSPKNSEERAGLACVSCNNDHRAQNKRNKERAINESGEHNEGTTDSTRNIVGNNSTRQDPREASPIRPARSEDSNFPTRGNTKKNGDLSRGGTRPKSRGRPAVSRVSRIRSSPSGRSTRDRSTIIDISSSGKNRNDSDPSGEGRRGKGRRWWGQAKEARVRDGETVPRVIGTGASAIRGEADLSRGRGEGRGGGGRGEGRGGGGGRGGGTERTEAGVRGGADVGNIQPNYRDGRKGKKELTRKLMREKDMELNVRTSENIRIYNAGGAGNRNGSKSDTVVNTKNDQGETNYLNHRNKAVNITVLDELRKKRLSRKNQTHSFITTLIKRIENVSDSEIREKASHAGENTSFGNNKTLSENNILSSHTLRKAESDSNDENNLSEATRTKRTNSDMYIHTSSSDREGSGGGIENGNVSCIPQNPQCKAPSTCWTTSADSPLTCSPCNLTYYGRVGTAYHLLVSGQQHLQPGSPCHVTFHARGGHYGDLVQVSFLTFNVGRFVQPLTAGSRDEEGSCIGGYVTLEEEGRPATGGRWCGEGRGRNVVFSEGPSLRLILHPPLFSHHAVPSPEVVLRYTMVRREDALLRYGSPSNPKNRGELVANTACSRVLTDCRSNNCRVQSPNYPGVYPRNLTCFYLVKLAPPHINREAFEKEHPRPVVVLSQPNDRLIQIGPAEGARLPRGRLKWENECRGDVLLVYDGGTTKAPLLARVCGGGAPLPNITASKSEVLVVFLVKASGPMTFEKETVTGFEIDVSIAYLADSSAVTSSSTSLISEDAVSSGPREALVTFTPAGPQVISSSPSPPSYVSAPRALPSVWLGSTCRLSDLYQAAAPPSSYSSSTQPSSSSASYPPSGPQCCHVVRSQGIGGGIVHSVQHAMPANSSCLLVFVAKADQVVWLYFIRYVKPHLVHPLPHYNITCHSRLAIVDGFPPALKKTNNSSVLGEFCGDSSPPLCVRARQQGTTNGSSPPPCRRHESFVSTGNVVSVVQDYTMTSALWPLTFSLRYEFVNARRPTPNAGYLRAGQDVVVGSDANDKANGANYGWSKTKNACSKVVLSSSASSRGSISSPDNVFLFGRGGQANLTCTFVFEQKAGERIAVRVTELMVRSSSLCATHFNRSTSLPECRYNKNTLLGTRATLMVHEAAPWNGSDIDWVRLGCLCSQDAVPITIASVSSTLMLTFSVFNMDWNHDHRHFAFEAEYEYKTTSRHCLGGTRTLGGTTGELLLGSDRGGFINPCHNLPWKVIASPFTFLHLSVQGVVTGHPNCTTTNRILLYNDLRREPVEVICPSNVAGQYVQVFSSGWKDTENSGELADESLIVRYLWRESGHYLVKWLEVQRSPRPSKLESEDRSWQDWLYSLLMQENPVPFCSSYCPDLGACIAPKLWCDGIYHCPSGADELSCLNGSLPWFYITLGSLVFLLLFLSFICVTVSLTVRCFGKKVGEANKSLCRPEAIIPKVNGVPLQENGGPAVVRSFGCRRSSSLPRERVEAVYTISYTPRLASITAATSVATSAATSIAADIRYATDRRA